MAKLLARFNKSSFSNSSNFLNKFVIRIYMNFLSLTFIDEQATKMLTISKDKSSSILNYLEFSKVILS